MFLPFSGAKIALLHGDLTVAYRRDNKPTIPFPNQWDLPGGGREGTETPQATALREAWEEFGLRLPEDRICWTRHYPADGGRSDANYFFAMQISALEVQSIRFGDEGQFWQMMPVREFIGHSEAVPYLRDRLSACWAGLERN